MAEKIKAKKAKKPGKKLDKIYVVRGVKKAPGSRSEVAGHQFPGAYYNCWHCLAVNWVPAGASYFYCWRDWALNWV